MDDSSVFRRFFVVSNLLRDVIGMITGREPSESMGSSPGETPVNPFIQSEAPIQSNQTVGGQSPPIQGTRPTAAPRRRRRAAPQLPNTARYGFPKPDESV